MHFSAKPAITLVAISAALLLLFSTFFLSFAQDNPPDTSAEATNGSKIFLPLVAGAGQSVAQTPDAVTTADTLFNRTDQIIVRYAGDAAAAGVDRVAQVQALSAAAAVDLAYVRELTDNTLVLKLPDWQDLAALDEIRHKILTAVAEVDLVEPDAWQTISQTPLPPNDPSYSNQWHYFTATVGTYGASLPGAWQLTTGSASVVVAVIDTGIRPHADLTGRIVPGYDFIADSTLANDGNGRDTDPSDPGDWITAAESSSGYFAGCPVGNSSWHGTHVAGTIAANSNNGVGVAGINWNAKILPVRVLGKCGGYTSDIVDGIRWAAGLAVTGVPNNPTPARVINLSLGGSGACSSTYQNAITAAVNAGTTVVVAAGNSNANAANYTPASCANVITVAATGRTGNRAYYSNYGTVVELSAPGGDKNIDSGILSTLNSGTTVPGADSYAAYQGTSMATPHVAGIVSLLLAVNPTLTPAQITSLLQTKVTPFPAGSTCTTATCGTGIINAAAAVAAAKAQLNTPPNAFAKSAPANSGSVTTASTTLSWAASVGATSYTYCLDRVSGTTCDSSWVNVGTATSVAVATTQAGASYWQVRAVNATGTTEANSGTWWTFTVQAGTPPAAFNKSSPTNGSTGVSRTPTVRWAASSGATSYEVCLDTSNDNLCAGNWTSVGAVTQATFSRLSRRVTYYWQVRAVNAIGRTDANAGIWWRFTTQ